MERGWGRKWGRARGWMESAQGLGWDLDLGTKLHGSAPSCSPKVGKTWRNLAPSRDPRGRGVHAARLRGSEGDRVVTENPEIRAGAGATVRSCSAASVRRKGRYRPPPCISSVSSVSRGWLP